MADMLLEAGKTIAKVFADEGYDSYIAGRKCHIEVHNKIHDDKIKSRKLELVTNAPVECVRNIFTRSENSVGGADVTFANEVFHVICLDSINSYLESRFFTIDAVLGKPNGEMIDFFFKKDGRECSSFDDISNKLIRLMGNPSEAIAKNPILILCAFELMAQYGYNIESATLNAIKKSISLLGSASTKQIGKLLRGIVNSKHTSKALKQMQASGIFNVVCHFDDGERKLLEPLSKADLSNITLLDRANDSEFEVWSELLDESNLNELLKYDVFEEKEINMLKWLIKNKDIFKRTDYVQAISDSIGETEKEYDIHNLKELFARAMKKHSAIAGNDGAAKKFYFWLCARPYFEDQVDISLEEVNGIITDSVDEEKIAELKKFLLPKMTFAKACPRRHEMIDMLVDKLKEEGHGIIEEAVEQLKNPEEIKKAE